MFGNDTHLKKSRKKVASLKVYIILWPTQSRWNANSFAGAWSCLAVGGNLVLDKLLIWVNLDKLLPLPRRLCVTRRVSVCLSVCQSPVCLC